MLKIPCGPVTPGMVRVTFSTGTRLPSLSSEYRLSGGFAPAPPNLRVQPEALGYCRCTCSHPAVAGISPWRSEEGPPAEPAMLVAGELIDGTSGGCCRSCLTRGSVVSHAPEDSQYSISLMV